MKNYYNILDIPENSPDMAIKHQFRKLAALYHPDKPTGNTQKFVDINEAYKILGNIRQRADYDKSLRQLRSDGLAYGQDIISYRSRLRNGSNINISIDFTEDLLKNTNGSPGGGSDEFIEKTLTINRYEVCGNCGGEGKEPGTFSQVCPACGGTGIDKHSDTLIKDICPICKGYGDVFLYKCKVCLGAGRIRKDEQVTLKFNLAELIRSLNKKSQPVFTFKGLGDAGAFGGVSGVLNVTARVGDSAIEKIKSPKKGILSKLLPFGKKFPKTG